MLPSGGAWAHCRGRLWQGPQGVAQGPTAPWGERDLDTIGSFREQSEFNCGCRLLSFQTSDAFGSLRDPGRLHIAVFEQLCDHRQRDARHDGLVGVREPLISSQDLDAKPCYQGIRKREGMSIAGAIPRSAEVQRAALYVILCVSQLELQANRIGCGVEFKSHSGLEAPAQIDFTIASMFLHLEPIASRANAD